MVTTYYSIVSDLTPNHGTVDFCGDAADIADRLDSIGATHAVYATAEPVELGRHRLSDLGRRVADVPAELVNGAPSAAQLALDDAVAEYMAWPAAFFTDYLSGSGARNLAEWLEDYGDIIDEDYIRHTLLDVEANDESVPWAAIIWPELAA